MSRNRPWYAIPAVVMAGSLTATVVASGIVWMRLALRNHKIDEQIALMEASLPIEGPPIEDEDDRDLA